VQKYWDETWTEYIERCFSCTDGVYFWLFNSDWTYTDNTPTGAVKRAKFFIEHGGVPENYEDQLSGLSPLSY
jgi:hypothetical protein